MKTYHNQKISQIVTENLKAAEILENHDIDFCCGGDKTLGEACWEKNVPVKSVEADLEKVMNDTDSETTWIKSLDASELSDYIVKRHHSFIRENIPSLKKYLGKICEVHGENHPELFKVKEEFNKAAETLTDHLGEEEKTIFPVVHEMVQAKKENRSIHAPCFGIVSDPIRQMQEDHKQEGERFDRLAERTDNFKVPDDGCNTFRLTYERLKAFVSDLHKHIHLENNILFPEALQLEKETVKCD